MHSLDVPDSRRRRVLGLFLGLCLTSAVSTQHLLAQFDLPAGRTTETGLLATAAAPIPTSTTISSTEIRLKALETATSAPVVTALAASADGRLIAIAGDDHAIRILDASNGAEIQVVIGHSDWIRCIAFRSNPDPQSPPLLYSAGDDGRVLEWTYAQPLQSRELIRLPFAVRTLDISDDEQLLAFGGFSTDVLVWDLSNDLLRQRMRCGTNDQRCVQISPDNQQIVCGSRDGSLSVWGIDSGSELASYPLHRGSITAMTFSRDGEQLTTVGEDRRAVRIDLASGQQVWERELGKSKLQAMCVIDDQTIATAGSDNRIRLYDAATDGVKAELEGHWGTVAVLASLGTKLISGSFDTTVRIWDLETAGNASAAGLPVMTPVQMDNNWQVR